MYIEFQKFLRESGIDFALFFDKDANLTYFAGVNPDIACLVVPSSGRPLLFVPGFEASRLAKMSKVRVVRVDKDLFGTIKKHFSGKKAGVVAGSISYSKVREIKGRLKAEIVNVEDACRDLRVVKSRDEIEKITKACAITHKLFDELCENVSAFRTEVDAAAFLRLRMAQFGFEPSFPAIVASGPNGAIPHHIPARKKLSGFTVIDFGIIYKNYCSDMTRTVYVGNPTKKDRIFYDKLLKVQEKCIGKVKPGVMFEDINDFARRSVGRSMVHRVGHSLGIEVHDVQPRPMKLARGNVITIEPGTYYPGRFGIRIEDDVLVSDKPAVLTNASKELRILRR